MFAADRSFALPAHELATVVVVPVAENSKCVCAAPGDISDTSRSCRNVCDALKFTDTFETAPVTPATVKVTSLKVVLLFWQTGDVTSESGIAPNVPALAAAVTADGVPHGVGEPVAVAVGVAVAVAVPVGVAVAVAVAVAVPVGDGHAPPANDRLHPPAIAPPSPVVKSLTYRCHVPSPFVPPKIDENVAVLAPAGPGCPYTTSGPGAGKLSPV